MKRSQHLIGYRPNQRGRAEKLDRAIERGHVSNDQWNALTGEPGRMESFDYYFRPDPAGISHCYGYNRPRVRPP
jgi:hypothetical protein